MNLRYLYISLIIFLYACSNSSYYDISIPAKQSNRGDYGLVDLKGNLVVDFEIDQRPSIMTSNWSYFKEDGKIRFVNNGNENFNIEIKSISSLDKINIPFRVPKNYSRIELQ